MTNLRSPILKSWHRGFHGHGYFQKGFFVVANMATLTITFM